MIYDKHNKILLNLIILFVLSTPPPLSYCQMSNVEGRFVDRRIIFFYGKKIKLLFITVNKMGDEAETTGCTTEDGPQINQDELILAQQRQIEKEVSD